MIRYLFLLGLSVLSFWSISAQDNPSTATVLTDLDNACSDNAAYTNIGSTATAVGLPTCFSNISNDVWFSFTASAVNLSISVTGNNVGEGTLEQPEMALYNSASGEPNNLLACVSEVNADNFVEINTQGLVPGGLYFIRVEGENANVGTFKLCINNFNPTAEIGNDCIDAAILCDKSSFSVDDLSGTGSQSNEVNGTCIGQEFASSWYVWTAATTGTLEFTITPNKIDDDIDFLVYKLPGGPTDCANKQTVRCMAAGDFTYPSVCMGPTGLTAGNTDVTEEAGCGNANNSFLAPLDMIAGESYALLINNYTDSGNGFSISFGGTAEFDGPQADFNVTYPDGDNCVLSDIRFNDNSTDDTYNIVNYLWNFGVGGSTQTATGDGPHDIAYDEPGDKLVTLTIVNSLGCQVSTTEVVEIGTCCEVNPFDINTVATNTLCPNDATGAINIDLNNSPYPPAIFGWSTGADTEDLTGLSAGIYSLTVSDEYCDTVFNFNLTSPPNFNITDTSLILATCDGGSDGGIILQMEGGTAPYAYDWDDAVEPAGFVLNDNILSNAPIGFYDLTVRDANNCLISYSNLEVKELELLLDPTVQLVTAPSCFNSTDGQVEIIVTNGNAPYEYSLDGGLTWTTNNLITGLNSESFDIVIQDDDNCKGVYNDVEITPPSPVDGTFVIDDVSCSGYTDGSIEINPTGGVGEYTFLWNDPNNSNTKLISDLAAGPYMITVLDGNDCEWISSATVNQPNVFSVGEITAADALCFGEESGSVTVSAVGGNAPFTYSIDNINFQNDNNFENLPIGNYTVWLVDNEGCKTEGTFSISEPQELIVSAGADTTIVLGYDGELNATILNGTTEVSYTWVPDLGLACPTCPTTVIQGTESIEYTLNVQDSSGCLATDVIFVTVDKRRPFYLPTAFSPNQDGSNDVFTVYGGLAVAQVKRLMVFNRWGAVLHDAKDFVPGDEAFGWDGSFNGMKLPAGAYVFFVEVEYIDGETEIYKGDVTLMR